MIPTCRELNSRVIQCWNFDSLLLGCGGAGERVITAPPKPSAQTQFVLTKMDEQMAKDDARWDQVMENMDLLFAQVGEISTNQQKMAAQFSISTQVMEQLLADQQLLSKQIDATGQAVAKSTLNRGSTSSGGGRSPSPASSEEPVENPFHPRRNHTGDPHPRSGFASHRQHYKGFGSSRTVVPKLYCPRFEELILGFGRIGAWIIFAFVMFLSQCGHW